MNKYLPIGGLVATGFDSTGDYLLTITHSGRGVFSTKTWERFARDYNNAYPNAGIGIGIGPIASQHIPVKEMDYDSEKMQLVSADGKIILNCESDGISVEVLDI